MIMRRVVIVLVCLSSLISRPSFAQSAQVTTAALYRTFMIHTVFGLGTAFSIDVDKREYWITAKHMLTGIKSGPAGAYTAKSATVSLLSQKGESIQGRDQQWVTETFAVMDPGKDIDILVLVPTHALLPAEGSLNVDPGGIGFGADCEFVGFPYGGGWKAHTDTDTLLWLPYVKHCTVSGEISEPVRLWVLDGINNEGFSGGPVLFNTGTNQKVFAVISGFHTEAVDVLPAPTTADRTTSAVPPPPELPGQTATSNKQIVNVNSGFILAFDIQPAIEAIRSNPIGPLHTSN